MEGLNKLTDLRKYKTAFNALERIMYKDIFVNGICVRILGIHYMDNGPGWCIKSHKHSFFECHYVAENNVHTTLNGIEYEVKAGSYYIMPPGTVHSHRQCNPNGHIGFALRWELVNGSFGTSGQGDYKETKEAVDLIKNIPANIMKDDGSVIEGMLDLLGIQRQYHILGRNRPAVFTT